MAPSGLLEIKEAKKDEEDEWLLSIFKQIHIYLPFLEAMIHMPKGAKVLKDLLLHKEKLKKAASSVKLSEECSAIIQRSLLQKEGDPRSFTLPCLIGPLAVKNVLADLGASINLMPHSLFQRLRISKLKTTKMRIQLADRSIKYPIGVCENLLVKISKFIFPVDFVVLEIYEDKLVLIILRRPFLSTARSVIDVHEGKLSLRVTSETVTFNIGKSMKSKHSQWTEEEEGDDPNEVLAVSFYPRTEPVEPLKWKALKNKLKPLNMEPPKLELKELTEHLEYAFLQENNQLLVVISSALSTIEKTRLLEVLRNHKGAIA
ncbi:DNA-directed DNA polymerase [Tanacetum coccineum]